jgi:SAM-dependent methyltransferase
MTVPDERFDAIRDFYNDEYYLAPTSAQVPWHTARVGRRLGPMAGKHVLDVACGTGAWLGYFSRQGASVAGIDLSSKAIERCRAQFPSGEFHCGPAESLPFADGAFDLVTCMGSLEHFLDKPAALREMVRVARPGATVLILVPNAGFLTRRLGMYRGTNQARISEEVLPLDAWRRLLENAGLGVQAMWRDLHPLSWQWIRHGPVLAWPIRSLQALALTVWPVAWQYQVYFRCTPVGSPG